MKRLLLAVSLILYWSIGTGLAQITVTVTVTNSNATTTCTDPDGSPDPVLRVDVNTAEMLPPTYFPVGGGCGVSYPQAVYTAQYDCSADLPATLQMCLRAFENTSSTPCNYTEACAESICNDFSLPASGTQRSYRLELSGSTASLGFVEFTVAVSADNTVDNELPCTALDLGTIGYGDTLGTTATGNYHNLCADNIDDIQPTDQGQYLFNEAGVWFHFRTGSTISGLITVDIASDPDSTGDGLNSEVIVYRANAGDCDDLALVIPYFIDIDGMDARLQIICPQANTDYYVIVDGDAITGSLADGRGRFGIRIFDAGLPEAGDRRCDYVDLGQVPNGGQVQTATQYSNFCSGFSDDPFIRNFISRNSVWFSFRAPESGHVLIEGISDTLLRPIDIEMAVYRSTTNQCSGGLFRHIASQRTDADGFDESMDLNCLNPGQPYWILIDGSALGGFGYFDVRVSDAGDTRPVTQIDTTLCAGGSLAVGSSMYSTTGSYIDTVKIAGGDCDSIIRTELVVLEPLQLSVTQTRPAIGATGRDGQATAQVSGGLAPYIISWCNGLEGPSNDQLQAGDNCCVTLTDANGCSRDTCFTVFFTTPIVPIYQVDTLDCYGDQDGRIVLRATDGTPPYYYSWQQIGGSQRDTGLLTGPAEELRILGLRAGDYLFRVRDAYLDTTFTLRVVQPDSLAVSAVLVIDASCNAECDGRIELATTGGTGRYSYRWSGGTTTADQRDGLCAGDYAATVTDDKGCTAAVSAEISEPPPFIATAEQVQAVSCRDGADGIVTVTTNGQPIGWFWSSGGTQATQTDLMAGNYGVTVTNRDGCQASAQVTVTQPAEALRISIVEQQPISCFGLTDGALAGQISGPYQRIDYQWNTGATTSSINQLAEGDYGVSITNELGCTATADFSLRQPPALTAALEVQDINCLNGPGTGRIAVVDVAGGRPPYRYTLNDAATVNFPLFEQLEEGNYRVQISDATNCTLDLQTSLQGPPDLRVSLADDLELPLGDSLFLQAFANSDNVVYTWSHADSLRENATWVRPLESRTYRVSVFDTITFCRAYALQRVFVNRSPRVYAPTGFSPNGDGNNDRFFLFGGNDVVEMSEFRIFARYGQLVYERSRLLPGDPNDGWDGLIDGQLAPVGVYVFTVRVRFFDQREEVISGDVTLVR